jgi:hypothetical protein
LQNKFWFEFMRLLKNRGTNLCSINHKIILLFLNLLLWGLLFVSLFITCIIFPLNPYDRLHSNSWIDSRAFQIIIISVMIKIVYFHSLSSINGEILLHVHFRIVAYCYLLLVNWNLRFYMIYINVLKISLDGFDILFYLKDYSD